MGGAAAKEILLLQLSTCKTAANTTHVFTTAPGYSQHYRLLHALEQKSEFLLE